MTAQDGDAFALSPDPPPKPGEYVVVARRYRPRNFGELVGQGQVSQALANAINTSRVGHAYLFTGARGVGKTSTARIFAKALNCVRGPTTEPCGQCDICAGIASGDDVDVIEIDGASNRGIDEIRQLRSNVNVRPSRARFKIYIIDEVHMLTNQAFNALLKTLEEPPEHVKFIFCTTEADKIPITVLSRCQRFDFAPIEMKSIVDRLQHICRSEGIEADVEALQIIARRAAGSMRDSQSLLEQLLSFGGQRITVADVNAMLGTAGSARLAALADCVARRDAAAALAEVDAAVAEGVDLGQLTEQLLGYFRDCLAALVGCKPELLLHTSPADYEQVRSTGERVGLETLLAMAQILDQGLSRMRQSTHVRTLVEVALIRLCKLDDLDELPGLISQLRDGTGSLPTVRPRAAAQPASTSVPRNGPGGANVADVAANAAPGAPPPTAAAPEGTASDQKKTLAGGNGAGDVAGFGEANVAPLDGAAATAIWQQTLAEIGDMTADFAGRAESVAISGPNRLAVRFRKAYTSALQFCERPERRQKLEQTLSRLAGRTLRIDFGLLPEESAGTPVADAVPSRPSVNRRQRQSELMRHPLIRKASELFDTEILTVIDAPQQEETNPALDEGAS